MREQLGGDCFAALLGAYEEPPVRGLRVNIKKISVQELCAALPWTLTPTGILDEGFALDCIKDSVGTHPFHAAGLFYMQEPSAMAAVEAARKRLDQNMRVLDMCAAPGGKAGGVWAHMRGGLLVANEIAPSRAKTLQYTLERLGADNAAVVCAKPDAIARALPEYFDMVLVDAPCSGEGMFRKDDTAILEWSEEHVLSCAKRQYGILESAYAALAFGGTLVYSTCTFSLEENERNVARFTDAFTDMLLIYEKRLYPYEMTGEGHYVAVMEKRGGGRGEFDAMKPAKAKDVLPQRFMEQNLEAYPNGVLYRLADGRALIAPELPLPLASLHMLNAGLHIGDVKKDRFEPSHALALCADARFKRRAELSLSDERLYRYLAGETVPVNIDDGWCSVCALGYPVGIGKAVGGTLKNHLPKGLRIPYTRERMSERE